MSGQNEFAIIGLGNIGKVISTNLAKSGRSFIVADRDQAKAKDLAQKLGIHVRPLDLDSAIRNADMLLLSIPFGSFRSFLAEYASLLSEKIILDPSNPIAPDGKGGFAKIIGQDESAGEINSSNLPKGARLVKAFGTLGAASLAGAAFQKSDANVLFYASNDLSIDGSIEQLIRDAGFTPLRAGNLDQSIRLEVFGDLHEFGKLGKPVTKSEAEKFLKEKSLLAI